MKRIKYSKNDLTKILAFCALFLSAAIWLLAAIGLKLPILMFVKDAVLLLAISIPAHAFAKSLGKVWVAIFWVILIIFVFALVFGSFRIL